MHAPMMKPAASSVMRSMTALWGWEGGGGREGGGGLMSDAQHGGPVSESR